MNVNGLHKLWTLCSQLSIPAQHIKTAYLSESEQDLAGSMRMPGVNIPGLITAGTYLVHDTKIFCDITDYKNAIVVELHDEYYTKLVIEVENPQEAIKLLTAKKIHYSAVRQYQIVHNIDRILR